jgi:hypothetical protein
VSRTLPSSGQVSVSYVGPKTREETIGYVPQNDQISTDGFLGFLEDLGFGGEKELKPVKRPQPVLDSDGSQVYESKVKEIDLKPHSAWKWGAIGGLVGSGGSALVAAVVAGIAAAPAVAAAGLVIGAGLGAMSVAGDEVSLDFQEKDVVEYKFEGYTTSRSDNYSGTGKDRKLTSTDIVHTPKVSSRQIGEETYWEPYAKHTGNESKVFRWLSRPLIKSLA